MAVKYQFAALVFLVLLSCKNTEHKRFIGLQEVVIKNGKAIDTLKISKNLKLRKDSTVVRNRMYETTEYKHYFSVLNWPRNQFSIEFQYSSVLREEYDDTRIAKLGQWNDYSNRIDYTTTDILTHTIDSNKEQYKFCYQAHHKYIPNMIVSNMEFLSPSVPHIGIEYSYYFDSLDVDLLEDLCNTNIALQK